MGSWEKIHRLGAAVTPVRSAAVRAALVAAAGAALMLGCSSAPIKIECQELRTRLAYENLSDDQIRFVKQELDECEGRVRAAQAKDSAVIEGTEKRFTPEE